MAWFQNLERLLDMLPEEEALDDLLFVDVGCGSGELLLYAATIYPFSSFHGFDVSETLVRQAETNLLNMFPTKLTSFASPLNPFSVLDAREHRMVSSRTMFFMFNPFGWQTAKIWLMRNINSLRDTKSYLAISNDLWAGTLLNEGVDLDHWRNETFNLSLFRF